MHEYRVFDVCITVVPFHRLTRCSQYSEDSESGEVKKRFCSFNRGEEGDENTDVAMLKAKRCKSWSEHEASSSNSHEVCKRMLFINKPRDIFQSLAHV